MKRYLAAVCLPLALCAAPLTTWAGNDHDDDHHHRYDKHHGHRQHDRKEEYWDGACKVEREWKKDGEYKEKRECKPRH